jgi:serine/threonine protein phosphatase PrpC
MYVLVVVHSLLLPCRSLGDFAFKSPQPLISAQPFVNTHLLQPTDKLVLLTSDGVTDVLPDDDMLDIGLGAIAQVCFLTAACHHMTGAES